MKHLLKSIGLQELDQQQKCSCVAGNPFDEFWRGKVVIYFDRVDKMNKNDDFDRISTLEDWLDYTKK